VPSVLAVGELGQEQVVDLNWRRSKSSSLDGTRSWVVKQEAEPEPVVLAAGELNIWVGSKRSSRC